MSVKYGLNGYAVDNIILLNYKMSRKLNTVNLTIIKK